MCLAPMCILQQHLLTVATSDLEHDLQVLINIPLEMDFDSVSPFSNTAMHQDKAKTLPKSPILNNVVFSHSPHI